MLSKLKFCKKLFSTSSEITGSSLKQQKENILKNKKLEKVLTKHKNKFAEEEIEAALSKIKFAKIFGKVFVLISKSLSNLKPLVTTKLELFCKQSCPISFRLSQSFASESIKR